MRARATRLLSCIAVSCIAVALASAGTAAPAYADATGHSTRSTIAVLAAPDDPFGLRVVAELEALGFHVVVDSPSDAPASRASLEASARAASAIAAIRAVPSERGIEVWIADRVTDKTVLRELESDDVDRDALALRTVELLRASLLEITLPEAPRGEVAPTPAIAEKLRLEAPAAPAPQEAPTLRFAFAPGVWTSAGGVGAMMTLGLGVDWTPGEHVGVLALVEVPLSRGAVDDTRGHADLSAWLVGGAVRIRMTKRRRAWAPSVDLGMAAIRVESKGSATAPFRGKDVAAWAPAPFARFGLAFDVTRSVRLRADVLCGLVPHGVSIRFAGAEVANWGNPFVLPSLGADFGWF